MPRTAWKTSERVWGTARTSPLGPRSGTFCARTVFLSLFQPTSGAQDGVAERRLGSRTFTAGPRTAPLVTVSDRLMKGSQSLRDPSASAGTADTANFRTVPRQRPVLAAHHAEAPAADSLPCYAWRQNYRFCRGNQCRSSPLCSSRRLADFFRGWRRLRRLHGPLGSYNLGTGSGVARPKSRFVGL
jgi:hypothetical protein